MTKRIVILITFLLLTLSLIIYYYVTKTSFTITQDPTTKFNVIMIVPDALRVDALNCYGGDAKTPNIDWLATNGVLFKNAYSTSPRTFSSAASM